MARKVLRSLALAGLLGWLMMVGSHAYALTFTLTDNGWTYSEDTDSEGWGDFIDPNSVDHMYQNWWWFRIEGDNQETALSNLVFSNISSNMAQLKFQHGGNLFFELTYTLTGISPTQAQVDINWLVRNISSSPLTVNLFSYSDFDLNDSSSGDSGTLVNPQTIRYTEGSTAVDVIASAGHLVGYDVDHYPTLVDLLSDGSVYDVSNMGLPFGPGDMTNVFQWRASLDQGQAVEGMLTKLVNLHHTPVIPEPGTWLLMVSGLAPVALRLRRKA